MSANATELTSTSLRDSRISEDDDHCDMAVIVSLPPKDSTLGDSGAGHVLNPLLICMTRVYTRASLLTVSGQGRVSEEQYSKNEKCKPGHQEKSSLSYPPGKGAYTKTRRGVFGRQGREH